ncbi:MAG: triose-phosphate isomerase [Verrucomicrobia bacterium]|nr:triose-phosphate isomerase [Verrucomicrobiota bacterium]
MRKKILAANWKMNLTNGEASDYVQVLIKELGEVNDVEVVLVPPFTAIPALAALSERAPFIRLGAQNLHWEKSGAFTGEISAGMLRALYVKYVVVGHSERRRLFGESDAVINRKVRAALETGLRPILCMGESLQQRENDEVDKVLEYQLREGLRSVSSKELPEVVIAYEPVWAIGTGRTATSDQAQAAHAFARKVLASLSDQATAERVRIQYGGSVKPENTEDLMLKPDIDGALVGGASLDPRSFAQIIRKAEAALAA